jgi:uncharacterized membrane protein
MVVRRCFLVAMLAGAALITAASLVYFDTETLPPFVIEKFPLRFEALWLLSLRVHMASALLAFPLCLLLMTRSSQRRPRWHRWLGRVSGALVLLALVPSGVVLAFAAKGGVGVSVGFLLSAAIVAVGMVQAIAAARRREFLSHRRAAWHVVAQLSVAVTSRVSLVLLDVIGVDPELSYLISLWVPVLASAALVELAATRTDSSLSKRSVERISRETPALALVRIRSQLLAVTRFGR